MVECDVRSALEGKKTSGRGGWNVNQRLYSRNIAVVVEYIMRQPAEKGVAERKDVQRPIGMIRRQTQGEGERRVGLRKGEKRIPKGFDGQIIQWRI